MENIVCAACGWNNPGQASACIRCKHQFSAAAAPRKSVRTALFTVPLSILAVLGVVLFAALQFMSSRVVATPAYQDALNIASSSHEVQNLLGEQIKADSLPFGLSLDRYGSRFVEWETTLSGTRGKGHLYAVANEIRGTWEFSRLTLIADAGGPSIDLSPVPRHLMLPPVPEKKLYLVPLDLDPSESLDWAPTFYSAKFGIDVRVLPALQTNESLVDARRHQLDSEKCLDYLRKKLPDIAGDPSGILIAITSQDIFIRSLGWAYTENYRDDRFAIVSSARLKPPSFFAKRNPEWSASRLQKMLTKNVAILYFDFPKSNDYTSLLSGGVLSGTEIDLMSGSLIGAEGRWDPFVEPGEPGVTIYSVPGKPLVWKLANSREALPGTLAQVFNANLALGIFAQRQTDFWLQGDFPLQFVRVYRNQDELSRSFGIGGSDSLDVFLVGHMGSYVDLILEDAARVHFKHTASTGPGDTYQAQAGDYTSAVYQGDTWTITRKDGWKFYMPYRPKALAQNVTVLTGFSDPAGHMYRMERDSSGDLLSVTTPSGEWLHFERDPQHRVQRIKASTGRFVSYKYSPAGCLSQVTDSEGNTTNYSYDERARMLTVARSQEPPILTNAYDARDYIKSQMMADSGKFEYHYVQNDRGAPGGTVPDLVTMPNGRLIYFTYESGAYLQSLPERPPH